MKLNKSLAWVISLPLEVHVLPVGGGVMVLGTCPIDGGAVIPLGGAGTCPIDGGAVIPLGGEVRVPGRFCRGKGSIDNEGIIKDGIVRRGVSESAEHATELSVRAGLGGPPVR